MTKDEAVDEVLGGLYTDGSHHKQWALEKVLLYLVGKKELEKLRYVDEDGEVWVEGKSTGDKYEAWEGGIG